MISTERLILQHFSGMDTETGQMIKNWISDPLVQKEYGEEHQEMERIYALLTVGFL